VVLPVVLVQEYLECLEEHDDVLQKKVERAEKRKSINGVTTKFCGETYGLNYHIGDYTWAPRLKVVS
jgi:hypothetical protein